MTDHEALTKYRLFCSEANEANQLVLAAMNANSRSLVRAAKAHRKFREQFAETFYQKHATQIIRAQRPQSTA